MKTEFYTAVAQISAERGISPEEILEKVEQALISAYKRRFGAAEDVSVRIDLDTGEAKVYIEKRVVDEVEDPLEEIPLDEARRLLPKAEMGTVITIETTPRDFGRIAAQTARQVFMQQIREAERNKVLGEYADRVGEMINVVVRRVTPGGVYLTADRAELFMPSREQIPTERYRVNQHLQVYIAEVREDKRGSQIIASRSHPKLVERLFEMEVPEVLRGAVEIVALAREAGVRTKVAVRAQQPGVDPVGSCVGQRGVRIQSVVNALNGEKIDVVPWVADETMFIANALSPASVVEVRLDEETRTATVIVPDKSLSLAIGKEGQNARLAARLTGWRIDIKSFSVLLEGGEGVEAAEGPSMEETVLAHDPELATVSVEERVVRQDRTIVYQKVSYGPIPEEYVGQRIQVRGTSQNLYVYADGDLIKWFSLGAAEDSTAATAKGGGAQSREEEAAAAPPLPPEIWEELLRARKESRKVASDGTIVYQRVRYGPLPDEVIGEQVTVRSSEDYLVAFWDEEPIVLFQRGEEDGQD
ncbi:MAG: transcription termination/antitermination protein NusA [Chloroflexia bacterium]|nr:transcription termination/antitermination protein NusA [Chloroflexia bacterium]